MGIVEMMFLMLGLSFTGCDAEGLDVHVPRGGPSAVQPAAIKRDLWKMTDPRLAGRVPGSSGSHWVATHLENGMEAAGLRPAFDGEYRRDLGENVGEMVCGVRRGSGDQAVLIAAMDPGIGTMSVVPMAGLLSLAATFEAPQAPMHSLFFCSIPEASGLAGLPGRSPVSMQSLLEVFIIGTLTGPKLFDRLGPTVGHVQSRVLHSGPLAADLSVEVGQLDYGTIRDRLVDVHSVVAAVD
jgi:hypothetical protein